jgi:CRISPR system Cascade subunit CasE
LNAWLTRIVLNQRSAAAREDIRDAAAAHRRLMKLFPDGLGEKARQQTGVLFRLDHTREGPVMLVQSTIKPDPASLPDGYGQVDTREIGALLAALHVGVPVHYRIAGNTSKRVLNGERAGKVVALSGEAVDQWWQRKADAHGLRLVTAYTTAQPTAQGNRGAIQHAITRFDGRAMIIDPDRVRAAVCGGIGRGKAFGCGLLSLAVAR